MDKKLDPEFLIKVGAERVLWAAVLRAFTKKEGSDAV
jgi:hypothetical protein